MATDEPNRILYGGTEYSSKELVESYFLNVLHRSADEKDACIKNLESNGELWFVANCGLFQHSKTAECVFLLCELWNLPEDVKFLALELFDRFTSDLLCSIYKIIFMDESNSLSQKSSHIGPGGDASGSSQSVISSKTEKKEEWENSLERIQKQMTLRIVSSVTIASKVSSHYKVVPMAKAVSFLREEGYNYNEDVLIKSEMRLLKSIDYKLHSLFNPYQHIQIMLELMARTDTQLPVAELHPICIYVLELFHLHRNRIFSQVCKLTLTDDGLFEANDEQSQRLLLNASKDLTLLSCSIISAAAYVKSKSLSDLVIGILNAISGITSEDISRMASGMLSVILT